MCSRVNTPAGLAPGRPSAPEWAMRARLATALALGAVLAGGALWLASGPRMLWLPHAVAGSETVRILVAKRELPFGTRIAPKDLQWVEWPRQAVPPGSFTSVAALLGEERDGQRVVLRAIGAGEPVLESMITGLGEQPPASTVLPQGRRAATIAVDPSAGVAGFVAPGDRVDIMLIRRIDGQLVTSIIMQDVPVLAVAPRSSGDADAGPARRMVTVEVSISETQKLALAQQVGRLSLTLRGLHDGPNMVTADQLDGYAPRDLRPMGTTGDFGVPRGLCDLPPTAGEVTTMCDRMDFPDWPGGQSVRVRRAPRPSGSVAP